MLVNRYDQEYLKSIPHDSFFSASGAKCPEWVCMGAVGSEKSGLLLFMHDGTIICQAQLQVFPVLRVYGDYGKGTSEDSVNTCCDKEVILLYK